MLNAHDSRTSTLHIAFFAISIVAVLLIAGFFILKVYDKWSTTPVIFGIKPEPTFITKEPFPAVTICNLNQARKSKVSHFEKYSKEYVMLQLMCKKDVNISLARFVDDWSDLESFIVNISQSCEEMILGCRFGGKDLDCTKAFFPILTDEGLCCVFNMLHPDFMYVAHIPLTLRNVSSGKYNPINWYVEQGYPADLPYDFYPRKTLGTGESVGFSVTLNVEHHDYYCSSSNSVGFKMALHSPNESPNVRETGVPMAPSREIKVRITPQKTEAEKKLQSMDRKYRHCLFHSEGRLRYFAHYTQRNCEAECVAEMVNRHCGCISFYMPRIYANASVCSIKENKCVEKVRLAMDLNVKSCLDDCLPSCYDIAFFSDAFAVPISHEGFDIVNEKVQNLKQRYVEKSVAVINMYFKEYSFRSNIQTEFIGVSDFLASVGGLMGLFIGFSFISLAEFFYFAIIRPCRSCYQHRKAKKAAFSGMTSRRLAQMKFLAARKYLKKHLMYRSARETNRLHKSKHIAMNEELLKSISQSLEQVDVDLRRMCGQQGMAYNGNWLNGE